MSSVPLEVTRAGDKGAMKIESTDGARAAFPFDVSERDKYCRPMNQLDDSGCDDADNSRVPAFRCEDDAPIPVGFVFALEYPANIIERFFVQSLSVFIL